MKIHIFLHFIFKSPLSDVFKNNNRDTSMRLLVPVYAVTLLLSATLLFSVQPMFTKMILPLLGGTPQVWNTAMLFFQACLLGGYFYAHVSSKFLPLRAQGALHVILLSFFTIVLPFAIPEGWNPPTDSDPTFWQLSLMAMTVGGPFFVIAGSAPLFQSWFSASGHKDSSNPYFLYGASNLGSMTALLSYPIITEPLLALNEQAKLWMFGYICLIAAVILCQIIIRSPKTKSLLSDQNEHSGEKISNRLRLKWIALSAIPSSLMLGVTTYITTDIASVPMLWVIPLALYLATFIIVFANRTLLSNNTIHALSGFGVILILIEAQGFKTINISPLAAVCLHIIVFFLATLSCHKELADSKPSAKSLTEFYFYMSLGGVIGGFVNAIIAPVFLKIPFEYPLVLVLAMTARYAGTQTQSLQNYLITVFAKKIFSFNAVLILISLSVCYLSYNTMNVQIDIIASILLLLTIGVDIKKRWALSLHALVFLMTSPMAMLVSYKGFENTILRDRNFFGVIRVVDMMDTRFLLHGTTNHGAQPLIAGKELEKITYFSTYSPVADVYNALTTVNQNPEQKIGVIGLGIGAMACYQKDGRSFDFYEIDKEIADIAENPKYFTYLAKCGSPYQIILGDGRLTLAHKPEQSYDAIVIDAFSSDNIPAHLITKEAIHLYFTKIKTDGLIAFHISNNYLDLEPVLGNIANSLKLTALAQAKLGGKIEGTDIEATPSHYVVMTNNQAYIEYLKSKGWTKPFERAHIGVWTDKYTNLFSIFNNISVKTRLTEEKKVLDQKNKDQENENIINSK